jgi:tetratricopeptide (TPR) repeat protein
MLPFASRWILRLALAAMTGVFVWIVWRCWFDPQIRFMPPHSPAHWIMYPTAPEIAARPVAKPGDEFSTIFRRGLVLTEAPANAALEIRALENFAVRINGESLPPKTNSNWKLATRFDATHWLRSGSNEIEITVTNRAGLPLLWCELSAGRQIWISDASWESSYADAVWKSAHVATEPRPFNEGNPMRSEHWLGHALRGQWKMHLVLLGAAIFIAWRVDLLARRQTDLKPRELQFAALGALLLVWIAILLHNFRLVPPVFGFDAAHHLDNIRFIQNRHELPPPGAGWEAHQPPLYYFLTATLLNFASLDAAAPEGLMALRVFSLLCGLGQILFVFASLRILFPNELRRPLLGATFAAFLPAHLYHAHFVTNETLLALFISASFYFALRILCRAPDAAAREKQRGTRLDGLLLGVCLGAALLTKVSALIFVPILFAALLAHALSRPKPGVKIWLDSLLLPLTVCLLICGWYYAQRWFGGAAWAHADRQEYGTAWWQQDSYRTASYYLRFGQSLFHPFFAGFHSFWDGIYSTLWGDGLCGGAVGVELHPPWNYELLTLGYWLALFPSLAVAAYFLILLVKLAKRPSPEWLLLAGIVLSFGAAAIYFSLIAPGTSQARASFGLMLLVPVSALFAQCFHRVTQWSRWLDAALLVIFFWWALTSAVAHWIPSSSAQSAFLRASYLFRIKFFPESARLAEQGFRVDPSKPLLRSLWADDLNQMGRTNEARQLVHDSLVRWPHDPVAHLDAAFDSVQSGDIDAAIASTRHALELAPDHPEAAQQLARLLCRQRRVPEAIAACREALRLTPHDVQLHRWLDDLRRGKVPDTSALK